MQQLYGNHQFQHRTQEHNTNMFNSWNYHHSFKISQTIIYS